MKKDYKEMTLSPMDVEIYGAILVGSVSDKVIQLDEEIKVTPYQDGFADQGGVETVSFD